MFNKRPTQVEAAPQKKNYDIICPYCFKRYAANQVVFRVNYDIPEDENFKKKPDSKLNLYRRKIGLEEITEIEAVIDPVANSNLVKQKREKNGVLLSIIDINDEETTARLCPHCHKDLPITSGKGPTEVISVIGSTSVGKTVYLTILLNVLQSRTAMDFDAGCIVVDTQYLEIINENQDMLYINNEVLPPSPKETRIEPLVMGLIFNDENRPPVTLIFYDVAGEGMGDPLYVKKQAPHIQNSTGIMFLVDPLQITSIEEKIKILKNMEDSSEAASDSAAFRSRQSRRVSPSNIVTTLFQTFIGLNLTAKTQIPTAVVISKSDMLDALEGSDLSKNSNIFKGFQHKGKLNINQISLISREVEELLKKVDAKLINDLRVFTDKQYFAVSALGSNPESRKIKEAISPMRVDEPFLWLLQKWGHIGSEKAFAEH